MRKLIFGLMATVLITLGTLAMPCASASANAEGINTDIELTKEQKDEIAFLHKNVMDQKVGVINKYVEYGVFTKEKGDELISHLEKHYEKLEENGFIPKWDKKHKKHMDNEE